MKFSKIMFQFSILSALFLYAGCVFAQEMESMVLQERDTLYISVFAVNLRSGPGKEFEKSGVLYLNTPVFKMFEEDKWIQIEVSDTLDGWIISWFTKKSRVTGFDRDRILYKDADVRSKISAIKRMSEKKSGDAFEFLQEVILSHEKHDLGIEIDSLIIPEIFRGWSEHSITEAVPVLVSVMENEISGEIAQSKAAMEEIKVAAKDAIKILVRENE